MTFPPMLLHVNVDRPDGATVNVWLPLFLLWPVVLLLLVLPFVIAMVVDVALFLSGQTYHHYSVLLIRALALLGDTRGMVVRVRDGEAIVDVTVV